MYVYHTWGIMVTLERMSWRPICPILCWSTKMAPPAASINLNSANVMELFPAPVRPAIPICKYM